MGKMDQRKSLINEYKQSPSVGGVYMVTNTRSGRYLLDFAANIQSKQNAFNFMISTGSCMDYRLKADWEQFGSTAFAFEILETLEKKKEQAPAEFSEDLKTLAQLWGAKFDPALSY
jgi:hypothetical protein